MIRVTIEMVPHGIEEKKYKMYDMEIYNDGTGDLETGNYGVILNAEYTKDTPREGRITSFNRRTQSVWSLIGACLKLFGHTKHSPKNMEKL